MRWLIIYSSLVVILLLVSLLSIGTICSKRHLKISKTGNKIVRDHLDRKQEVTSSSMWFNNSWEYRKRLNIYDPVNNYQMNLNVSYDGGGNVSCEGNCNLNFSDLRFTGSDGNSLRPYWIEEKVNGNYAKVWVNTSGDSKMYMYYGNGDAAIRSNGTKTFIAFHEPIIQSTGNYDDSGTLITFDNVTNNIDSFIHYKYYYQANSNGAFAHIYTDLDGVQIDDNSFKHPYNGDSGADKDNVSTYHSRDFTENNENITDQVKFRFANGDYRVRIAEIRIRRYSSIKPSWDSFGPQESIPQLHI